MKIKNELTYFVQKQNKLAFSIDEEMLEDEFLKFHMNQAKGNNNLGAKVLRNLELNLKSEKVGEMTSNVNFLKRLQKKSPNLFPIDNKKMLEKVKESLLKAEKNPPLYEKLMQKEFMLKSQIDKGVLIYNPWIRELQLIQKRYALFFLIELFDQIKNLTKIIKNRAIYFTLFFDFRGRFYYSSMISPDKGWPFRFLYYYVEGKKPLNTGP